MKINNLFWGGALVLFGVLFLLQQQGLIANVFTFFWPLALMLAGGWLVLSVFWKPTPGADDTFSIALQNAKQVRYKFNHGAAQIHVSGGAPAGQALVGSAGVGMSYDSRLDGDQLSVKVDTGPSMIPFIGPTTGQWRYQLTNAVPATLKIDAGASSFELDLRDVQATHIKLNLGASSVNLTVPARGASILEIEAGAASFNLHVPDGTAARIRSRDGFSSLNIDTSRFPEVSTGLYQSPDYDTSPNRAEIMLESVVGSVTVK